MGKKRMSASPQRIYEAAQYAILGLAIITVVNILFSFSDHGTYYVSSVFTSYFAFILLEYIANIAVALAAAAVILVPFVLAFIFSKKKGVWMVVALALVALDLLVVIVVGILYEVLAYHILDLIAHAALIVLLALGVRHSKAALARDAAPSPDASGWETAPQRSPQEGEEGAFFDVTCSVAISSAMELPGLARFYGDTLSLGTNSVASSVLLGSALTPTVEKLRVPYTDIQHAAYIKRNERTVRLDFADGSYAFVVLSGANRDVFARFLAEHGVAIAPFAEQ